MLGHVVDDFAGHTRIIGGSSDTEVTELIAMPVGPAGPCAVMTVTPVEKWLRTMPKRFLGDRRHGHLLFPGHIRYV